MMQPDIQFRDGIIYDGLGSPGFLGCLDVTDGRISAVGGPERQAKKIIDCSGLAVSPGFLDVHTHADLFAADIQRMKSFLCQGVTTCIVGNCGFSAFPLEGEAGREHLKYAAGVMGSLTESAGGASFSGFSRAMDGRLAVNIASHAGHGALRAFVVGNQETPPSGEQIQKMCEVLDQMLSEGAAGLSLGLIYSPGSTSERTELVELAKAVYRHRKVLAVHLRDEGARLSESIEEILSIAEETNVHVHISHHKVMGPGNWGKSIESLELLQQGMKRGLSVSLDAYPYDAACSTAMVLFPPWVMSKGTGQALRRLRDREMLSQIQKDIKEGIPGWENLSASCGWHRLEICATASHDQTVEGKSLSELGEAWKVSPLEALAGILVKENGAASVVIRGMSQEDVGNIIAFPDTLIGSDSLFADGCLHPRKSGSFAKVFRYYVRGQKILTTEEAICRMTGKAAATFGLLDRGVLKEGYRADLAVFSPEKFCDMADFSHPDQDAEGMEHVYVNGKAVLEHGKLTGAAPGRVLCINGRANS